MRITRTHFATTAITGVALVAGARLGGPSPSSALDQPRMIAPILAHARHVAHIDGVVLALVDPVTAPSTSHQRQMSGGAGRQLTSPGHSK